MAGTQMLKCGACAQDIPSNSRFCLSCGQPVDNSKHELDPLATQTVATSPTIPLVSASQSGAGQSRLRVSATSGSLQNDRFLPGTLLAQRYRIIAKLGQGGMGEVYRADDLVLGQAVALKFLPDDALDNPASLDRFRNEVRIARQVSHPNVCRVYDVGEIDGHLYLSMEYVDGEDLGSLLRRIGRLPEDKALEIARKLCAGLAAAHEKGVLHRDLKPSNVMLDSKGQVLITDFGLAALANQVSGSEVRNGTPAYMAPEQLEGKEVTVRSEVYSLGLVLYEIFTGKRPFESATLADLVRTRNETAPASPSTLVRDLDPDVERVIMRCLERDPMHRPASALAVAAALGGDRLAAALAAGETPSPQMVAAAGDTSGLSPKIAAACLAFTLVGLAILYFVDARDNGYDLAVSENPPEVLRLKARQALNELGYKEKPADSASQYFVISDIVDYYEAHAPKPRDWAALYAKQPKIVRFWYRESPRPMNTDRFTLAPGMVTRSDPPVTVVGMKLVELDDEGRLTYLEAVPPQFQEDTSPAPPPDWGALFRVAGLDMSKFTPAEPQWTSLTASDARAAWTGNWPGSDLPLRVEAAAWRGKPVFFKMVGPWTNAERMGPKKSSAAEKAIDAIQITISVLVLVIPAWLAWVNVKRGKSDRRGAFRLGFALFVLNMLLWLCRGHFAMSFDLYPEFLLALCSSLYQAGMVWLLYLGLEPYVRRYWPQTIISWSRLLAGQVRDLAVGRDVLFGTALGMAWIVIFAARGEILRLAGKAPGFGSASYLGGFRSSLGAWLAVIPSAVTSVLVFFLVLFLFRRLFRNPWIAGVVFTCLWALLQVNKDHLAVDIPVFLAIFAIVAVSLLRFGLLTLAVAILVTNTLGSTPITTNTSAWYFANTAMVALFIVALAAWAFHASIAGKKLFPEDLLG